jgi:hypothetical protein
MADFAIMDCALANVATGRRAQTLREMRDILRDVHPGCIYHHFWGTLLRPQFSSREYNNDFADWCHSYLHDNRVAERLAVIDPADYQDIEDLRQELIDVLEERLDETEVMLFAQADQQFHFVRSVIVEFDTHKRLKHPQELVDVLPQMSVGSIFYHLIDARRRDPASRDDFRIWLLSLGPEYQSLCDTLAEVDPYFDTLFVLRHKLTEIFAAFFGAEPPSDAKAPSAKGTV